MEVLIDADFILEALINRENFIEDAETLWNLLENQEIRGLMTDIGFKKICIFVKKLGGIEAVEQITLVIKSIINVKIVDEDIIEEARSFELLDFESAVEIVCAYTWKVGAIVTQNIQSFSEAEIPILSISQLLERQILENQLLELNPKSLEDDINPSLVILHDEVKPINNGIFNKLSKFSKDVRRHLVSGSPIALVGIVLGLSALATPVLAIKSVFVLIQNPSLVSYFFKPDFLSADRFASNPLGYQEGNNSPMDDYLISLSLDRNFNNSDKTIRNILDDDTYKMIATGNKLLENQEPFDTIASNNFSVSFSFNHSTTATLAFDTEEFNAEITPNKFDQILTTFLDSDISSFKDSPSMISLLNDVASIDTSSIDTYTYSTSAMLVVTEVPDPSAIIGLTALSVFGLGHRCTRKKNKTKNNKNHFRTPETTPSISKLDFVVDHSTNNKGNGN